MIFRKFDCFGLGIQDHIEVVPALSTNGAAERRSAALLRPVILTFKTIRDNPQAVKNGFVGCAANLFKFQIFGAALAGRLACRLSASAFKGRPGRLLADKTIIRLSCGRRFAIIRPRCG